MDPEAKEGLDIEEAASGIATDLFGPSEPVEQPEKPEPVAATPASEPAPDAPAVRPPPQAWKKDYHQHWGKIPAEAQVVIEEREKQMLDGLGQYKEYHSLGKAMNEAILPYMPIIQAQGVEPAKAVQALFNAHYRITQGTREQRYAEFKALGERLGILDHVQQQQVDPALKALQERQDRIESSLTKRQREEFEASKTRVAGEVNAFADAKDDKGNLVNPYFNEVADDIIVFIGAGMNLNDAYDKAVWANPVTRAKETARLQTEAEAKLRGKSKQEADAARRASSTNVRSRDTRRAPTEPLGTMEDTLKTTLAEVKSRTH